MPKISSTSLMFDQAQYDMLMRCVKKADYTEWHQWRSANPGLIKLAGADFKGVIFAFMGIFDARDPTIDLSDAFLAKANFEGAVLGHADLSGANFEGANIEDAELKFTILRNANFEGTNLRHAKLYRADLKSARLWSADLQGSDLKEADLQDAWLKKAKLQSAKFILARVDGKTSITGCEFDKDTDFTGVGLDAATIDPDLKAALKDNIRRIQWQKWFAKGNWAAQALKNCFVRPFWWMTGYGSSTANIIYYFVVLAYLFGSLYFILEVAGCGVVEGLGVANMPWYHIWLRGLYFSVVTMTTLGFGDLYAMKTSYWGHILLMAQVILGYVLLGALVTRLGILFSSEAPAAKPTPIKLTGKQSN